MFLSDNDIKAAVKSGAIIIEPFSEEKLSVASYDVTLGNEFEIVDRHQIEASDTGESTAPNTLSGNPNQKVGERISEKFPDSRDGEVADTHIQLKPDQWNEIATWLKTEEDLLFDSLQCITGMDLGENVLEARYNLHSMKHRNAIEIRIAVSREIAQIPSIEQVWRIGDWFERETYDMYGIRFTGHGDLRRILLPEDWEGWPLRKDYEVQETYHGIMVPKVKEGWE